MVVGRGGRGGFRDIRKSFSHCCFNVVGHRLRRWPNIATASGECPVFGGQVRGDRGGFRDIHYTNISRLWTLLVKPPHGPPIDSPGLWETGFGRSIKAYSTFHFFCLCLCQDGIF